MLVVMEYCITDIDISALYNWGGCFRTFCYNNLWWLLQAPCHNYLWVVTSKESAVRKAQSSSVYHHFVFYIYKKTLQVTNLLQLKYNKNTIIKTLPYNTQPSPQAYPPVVKWSKFMMLTFFHWISSHECEILRDLNWIPMKKVHIFSTYR